MNNIRIVLGLIAAFFILTSCGSDGMGRAAEPEGLRYEPTLLTTGQWVDCIPERTSYGYTVHECNWATLRESQNPA